VRFLPADGKSYSGTLTIESNDPSELSVSVSLTGAGIAEPDIQLSATGHDFGTVSVGSHADWDLTIRNVGSAPLTVNNITSDSPALTITSPGFPQNIYSGESLNVTVRLSPIEMKSYIGTLTISSNDPDEPEVYALVEGTGLKPGCAIIVTGKEAPWYKEILPWANWLIDEKATAAYTTLRTLGFDSNSIFYLNNITQDADGDGHNDVDGDPTQDPTLLEEIITEWAPQRVGPSGPFVLYMVGHGNENAVFGLEIKDPFSGELLLLSSNVLEKWLGESFPEAVEMLIIVLV
jgi:hypothetical protein